VSSNFIVINAALSTQLTHLRSDRLIVTTGEDTLTCDKNWNSGRWWNFWV